MFIFDLFFDRSKYKIFFYIKGLSKIKSNAFVYINNQGIFFFNILFEMLKIETFNRYTWYISLYMFKLNRQG